MVTVSPWPGWAGGQKGPPAQRTNGTDTPGPDERVLSQQDLAEEGERKGWAPARGWGATLPARREHVAYCKETRGRG
ncbi:hypothetical protein GCM10023096_63320 [Nonomuraea ferruginea]